MNIIAVVKSLSEGLEPYLIDTYLALVIGFPRVPDPVLRIQYILDSHLQR